MQEGIPSNHKLLTSTINWQVTSKYKSFYLPKRGKNVLLIFLLLAKKESGLNTFFFFFFFFLREFELMASVPDNNSYLLDQHTSHLINCQVSKESIISNLGGVHVK